VECACDEPGGGEKGDGADERDGQGAGVTAEQCAADETSAFERGDGERNDGETATQEEKIDQGEHGADDQRFGEPSGEGFGVGGKEKERERKERDDDRERAAVREAVEQREEDKEDRGLGDDFGK
jgi:hypothetical protein